MSGGDQSKIRPNTFQCPNALVDDNVMSVLTGNETKCYLVIVRKTYGWGKDADRIAKSQIMEATGLGETAVDSCMDALVSFGLVLRKAENDPNKNHGVLWALQTDDDKIAWDKLADRKAQTTQKQAKRLEKARAARSMGGGGVDGQPLVDGQGGGGVDGQPPQKPLSKGFRERDAKSADQELQQSDFYGMTVKDAQAIRELQIFHQATNVWPGVGQWWLIYQRIRANSLTVEQVRAIFEQWCGRGYNANNIDYLLYASSGEIPSNRPSAGKKGRNNYAGHQPNQPAAQQQSSDADRAAAERVRARRERQNVPV